MEHEYHEYIEYEYPGLKSWGDAAALSGPGASCDDLRCEVLNERFAFCV